MTDENQIKLTSWRDSTWWQTLEAIRPWLSWGTMGLVMIFAYYLSQRDTSAQQTVSLSDQKAKLESLERTVASEKADRLADKKEMVTRELFNERTEAFQKQLTNIDNRTIEILDRLPVRNP